MKVAVASGKGGTGKTSLSVNWFAYLKERSSTRVVLVDLDVEEPNTRLFIKENSSPTELNSVYTCDIITQVPKWQSALCSFCGKCHVVCNFNALAQLPNSVLVFSDLCHSCYACSELCPEQALPMTDMRIGQLTHHKHNELADHIEGKMDVGKESPVPLIKDTLNYTHTHFPSECKFIYDAPPGTSCSMIEAVKDADFVVLVTEPTPFGLHDLKLAVETVRQLHKPFGVVINRDGIGDDRVERYCTEEGIELLGKLPNSKEIAQQYAKGLLFFKLAPNIERFFSDLTKRVFGGDIYV